MPKIQWSDLNERQRQYMLAIYEHDQVQEQNERWYAARTRRSRPADEWRWIEYADTESGHTPLKQDIVKQKLSDHGTGSTFKALEARGLILRREYSRDSTDVEIRLTTAGRKLVRGALDVKPSKALPPGTLREWHWRALCRAYVAGDNGFTYDDGPSIWHRAKDEPLPFGFVSWNTILRLRDYRAHGVHCPLIREGRRGDDFSLIITSYGKYYYEENWQRYREMYPDVDAPEPAQEEE